jgi:hypothetical protein
MCGHNRHCANTRQNCRHFVNTQADEAIGGIPLPLPPARAVRPTRCKNDDTSVGTSAIIMWDTCSQGTSRERLECPRQNTNDSRKSCLFLAITSPWKRAHQYSRLEIALNYWHGFRLESFHAVHIQRISGRSESSTKQKATNLGHLCAWEKPSIRELAKKAHTKRG